MDSQKNILICIFNSNFYLQFQVNCGFEMLRTHIPSAAKHKKMSKVDTLRHAVEYIQSLNRMLNRNSTADSADSETDNEDEKIQSSKQKNSSNQHPTSIQNNNPIKLETPLSPPPEPTLLPPHPASTSTSNSNIHGFTENYESGYETSSYYSSSCNSMISPVLPTSHPAHEHFNNPIGLYNPNPNSDHYMELNPTSQSRDYKYLPGQVINQERNYDSYYHNNLSIEPNSEEDELLDAIANWQDA